MTVPFSRFAALPLAAVLAFSSLPAQAQEEQPFSSAQQDAIKKLVREYIIENPTIIAEAIEALREKEQLAAEIEAKKALSLLKSEIYEDAASPVLGNLEGTATVVLFSDYRCPYCKSMSETLFDVIKADGKVRLIVKELPVLGPQSVFAAKAALAAQKQQKFEPLHRKLMRAKGPLTDEAVLKAAAEAGLDVAKLKTDMEDVALVEELDRNGRLAQSLNIRGTPALIIGEQLIPGAVSAQSLKQLLNQARNPAKKG